MHPGILERERLVEPASTHAKPMRHATTQLARLPISESNHRRRPSAIWSYKSHGKSRTNLGNLFGRQAEEGTASTSICVGVYRRFVHENRNTLVRLTSAVTTNRHSPFFDEYPLILVIDPVRMTTRQPDSKTYSRWICDYPLLSHQSCNDACHADPVGRPPSPHFSPSGIAPGPSVCHKVIYHNGLTARHKDPGQ